MRKDRRVPVSSRTPACSGENAWPEVGLVGNIGEAALLAAGLERRAADTRKPGENPGK